MPKQGRINRWNPKKWKPEYDRIVVMSVAGMSNVAIAEKIGFTKEHVSSILNLPQGLELTAKLQARLVTKLESSIEENLASAAKFAAQRIKDVLSNDNIAEKSPFAITGLALDVLKGLGNLKGGGNGALNNGEGSTTNIGAVIINPSQKSDIMEGLNKIAEVRKLHLLPKAANE